MTAVLLSALLSLAAPAAPPAAPPAAGAFDNPSAHAWFTDVVLQDQSGRSHRLYSDLIRGRVVVISTFFSTCEASCPVTNRNLMEIQRALGERLGKEVLILSITQDPVQDTPAKLAEYSKQFQAREGWYFLTGAPDAVATALYKTGQQVPNKEAHLSILAMGNDRTGLWKKVNGMSTLPQILSELDSVTQDRL